MMNNLVTFQHTRAIKAVELFMGYTCVTHGSKEFQSANLKGRADFRRTRRTL